MKKIKTKERAIRSNLKPQPGQYVIGVDESGKKNWLMQVTSVSDGVVSGDLDAERAYEPKRGSFPLDKVLVVLSDRPPSGSVLGITVEPYQRSLTHRDWGDVHFFSTLNAESKSALKKSLDVVAQRLKRLGIFGFVADGNMAMEIRPPKGKHAGSYRYAHKKDEPCDRMVLRPKPEHAKDMNYVLAHESGHGVWFRLVRPKLQARWIRLFKSYIKSQDFTDKQIRDMRDNYIESSTPVRDFRGQLEDEDTLLFDSLISTLTANTRITAKHLDVLAESGELESIKDVWPLHLEDSDFDIAITEYGTKNVEELFAETFAFWLMGGQVPKLLKTAMDKTVAAIKS